MEFPSDLIWLHILFPSFLIYSISLFLCFLNSTALSFDLFKYLKSASTLAHSQIIQILQSRQILSVGNWLHRILKRIVIYYRFLWIYEELIINTSPLGGRSTRAKYSKQSSLTMSYNWAVWYQLKISYVIIFYEVSFDGICG